MLRLCKYLGKKELLLIFPALVLIVLQTAFDLALPDYTEEITLLVEHEGSEMNEILVTGGKMLASALASLLCAALSVLFASRAAASFCATLRERLFDRVESFSGPELDRFTLPSLINRTTSDVWQVQLSLVLVLEVVVKAPIKIIWALFKISAAQYAFALAAIAGILVLLAITVSCLIACYPKFRSMQRLADDLNRITRDNLQGIHAVRAAGGEHFEEERFEEANERLTRTHLYTARSISMLSPAVQLTSNALTVIIYFIGALLINGAATSARVGLFSESVAFVSYMMQILSAFLLLVAAATLLPRAVVSAKRINEVLDVPASMREGDVTKGEEGKLGEIAFHGVTFRYPNAHEDALCDVSFTVARGERVAIIGGNHSGKSVAVHLMLRDYDPDLGNITMDGVDLRDYTEDALHRRIGYVEHEPFLFVGSVRENVAFGNSGARTLLDEEMEELIRISCAEEMIRELPHGVDTHIVEGGANLSGGEAHRIALMRALCKRPEVLILDDVFSAFDLTAVRAMQSALSEHCRDMTVITVTRRVSTALGSDRILVLDGGRIVGAGTHEQLLHTCDVYRHIADAQRLEVSEHD